MTNPEKRTPTRSSQETERPESNSPSLEYFKVAADIIEDTSRLIEALNTEKIADVSEYTALFYDSNIRNAALPEIVQQAQDAYGTLEEVQIDTAMTQGDPASELTLLFLFANAETDEQTLLNVHRPAYYYDMTTHDTVTLSDGEQKRVAPISQGELSQYIASLCYPSQTGDYSQFRDLNLNDAQLYEVLVDLLQKHSQYYSGNLRYDLQAAKDRHTDAPMNGFIEYTDDYGEIISSRICQVIQQSKVEVDDARVLHLNERSVLTEINMVEGISIHFYIDDARQANQAHEPLSADISDYNRTAEFIKVHIENAHPVQPEQIRDVAVYDDTRKIEE